MYPYRFKTEEEFEKEYGRNWRIPREDGLSFPHAMSFLLGEVFPFTEKELESYKNELNYDYRYPMGHKYSGWYISWDMLTKNEEYWKPKKPSYKPKGKIKRINESVSGQYPYRFKTEEEFEKEFTNDLGHNWRDIISFSDSEYDWIPEMDFMFGIPYPNKIDNVNSVLPSFILHDGSRFGVSSYMLTKNEEYWKPKKPSYKPKGKIKRIGESIDIKTEKIIKVYTDSYHNAIEFQNLLQQNGYAWHFKREYDVVQWFLGNNNENYMYFNINIKYKRLSGSIDNITGKNYYVYPNEKGTILSKLKIRPSYQPKGKIKRIGESFNTSKESEGIAILTKNKDEFLKIFNLLKKYNYGFDLDITEFRYWKNHEVIMFISIKDRVLYSFLLSDFFHIDNFKNNSLFDYVWDNILTIDNITIIDSILKSGKIINRPSYQPKGKIKRIGESISAELATEIAVIVNSIEELEIFKNVADKNEYIFTDYDHVKHLILRGIVIVIFFDIKNKTLWGSTRYDSMLDYFDGGLGFKNVWHNILTIKDLNKLENIVRYNKIHYKPSYQPKGKIKRINEKHYSYPYREIVIRVENMLELLKLEKMLTSISNLRKLSHKVRLFHNYIFIDLYKMSICYLSDLDNSDSCLEDVGLSDIWRDGLDEKINPKIFTINDLEIIKNIILHGKEIVKPSYKPKRKITRIGESFSNDNRISVYVNGYNNALQFQKILQNNGYTWHNDGTLNVVQWFLESDQSMYFIIDIDKKDIGGNMNNICSCSKYYTYPVDKERLLTKLRIKPSYKPKEKITRIGESVNEKNGLKLRIYVKPYDKENALKLEEILQDNGYAWHEDRELNIVDVFYNNNFGMTFIINKTRKDLLGLVGNRQSDLIYPDDKNKIMHNIGIRIKPSYQPKGKIKR